MPVELEIAVAFEQQQEMGVGKRTQESLMIDSQCKHMREDWMEVKENKGTSSSLSSIY